jgi:hypothetical protein
MLAILHYCRCCCILALSSAFAQAACSVTLLPLTTILSSMEVGCKFQVVVATEQEWTSDMLVCIWPTMHGFQSDDVTIPGYAQCVHGAVGSAVFSALSPGMHALNAAIVQGSANKRVSRTASITVEATSPLHTHKSAASSDAPLFAYAPEVRLTWWLITTGSVTTCDKNLLLLLCTVKKTCCCYCVRSYLISLVVVRSGCPGCP